MMVGRCCLMLYIEVAKAVVQVILEKGAQNHNSSKLRNLYFFYIFYYNLDRRRTGDLI